MLRLAVITWLAGGLFAVQRGLDRLGQKRKQLLKSKESNTLTRKSPLEFFSDSTHFLPVFWYDGGFVAVVYLVCVFNPQ